MDTSDRNSTPKLAVYPVLDRLFPRSIDSVSPVSYRHIYNRYSFDNYFTNHIYNALRIQDMTKLFGLDWNAVKTNIDKWINDDEKNNNDKDTKCNKTEEFINFLYDKLYNNRIYDKNELIIYSKIISYLLCKSIFAREIQNIFII